MLFGSKCSILNGKVIDIEKTKLNIADMWLIPLDRVTYNEITGATEFPKSHMDFFTTSKD